MKIQSLIFSAVDESRDDYDVVYIMTVKTF